MNYSHAFHAGNFADVMKHIVLTRLVEYLKKKDAAFRVIDTHAGIGQYDLTGAIARRSPEWLDGIGKVLKGGLPQKAQALAKPYLDVIAALNPGDRLETYPGSPLLVRKLFRQQDRLSALRWGGQVMHLRYSELLLESLGDLPSLSEREAEILAWVARGKSNASIGEILGISAHTVDAHLRRIYLKLGVVDRISAALRGLGFGLIRIDA